MALLRWSLISAALLLALLAIVFARAEQARNESQAVQLREQRALLFSLVDTQEAQDRVNKALYRGQRTTYLVLRKVLRPRRVAFR